MKFNKKQRSLISTEIFSIFFVTSSTSPTGVDRLRHDSWNAQASMAIYIWNSKDVGYFSIQFAGTLGSTHHNTIFFCHYSCIQLTARDWSRNFFKRAWNWSITWWNRQACNNTYIRNRHHILDLNELALLDIVQVIDQPKQETGETYAYFTGSVHVPSLIEYVIFIP